MPLNNSTCMHKGSPTVANTNLHSKPGILYQIKFHISRDRPFILFNVVCVKQKECLWLLGIFLFLYLNLRYLLAPCLHEVKVYGFGLGSILAQGFTKHLNFLCSLHLICVSIPDLFQNTDAYGFHSINQYSSQVEDRKLSLERLMNAVSCYLVAT